MDEKNKLIEKVADILQTFKGIPGLVSGRGTAQEIIALCYQYYKAKIAALHARAEKAEAELAVAKAEIAMRSNFELVMVELKDRTSENKRLVAENEQLRAAALGECGLRMAKESELAAMAQNFRGRIEKLEARLLDYVY